MGKTKQGWWEGGLLGLRVVERSVLNDLMVWGIFFYFSLSKNSMGIGTGNPTQPIEFNLVELMVLEF